MLEIITFSIGVMYTPGPVNLLSLNNGMQKQLTAHVPFSLGVACALSFWFALVGYAGTTIISHAMLPYIGILGCAFILYLAAKLATAPVTLNVQNTNASRLTFMDGLLMQLLNPKAFMVVFPVTTVLFPRSGITGGSIAIWSALLGLLGFGAPTLYAAMGAVVGRRIANPTFFNVLNKVMGLLLVLVACDMAYQQVYLPMFGPQG